MNTDSSNCRCSRRYTDFWITDTGGPATHGFQHILTGYSEATRDQRGSTGSILTNNLDSLARQALLPRRRCSNG
jgi:hypothetical protein